MREDSKETVMHWSGARWEVGGWRQEFGNHYHQVYDDRMKREKRAMTKSRAVSAERSHKG